MPAPEALATALLIPFAASAAEGAQTAIRSLQLPHLDRLLRRLAASATDRADASSLSPPHERALARAAGLPAGDGAIPWAAWQVAQRPVTSGFAPLPGAEGTQPAWAWVTPCHWDVGVDRMTLADPADLQLDTDTSRTLLQSMRPWFAEDGIALHFDRPGRWLAHGDVFNSLATASLDRVIGHEVDPWMPRAPQASALRRLQSEMQMLLYTHPINDQRAQRGLPPVNSFWVSGAGALVAGADTPVVPFPKVNRALAHAALRQDWAAWAEAWQALDAGDIAQLLTTFEQTGTATLTLCSDTTATTFTPTPNGLLERFMSLFGRKSPSDILLQL